MKKFFSFRDRHSIGFKILLGVLVISGLATCVIASYQLYRDYRTDVKGIEDRLQQIEASYLKSVTNSIWEMNEGQVKISLEGILNLPDVESVVVIDRDEIKFKVGDALAKRKIIRKYQLNYELEEVSENVGELIIYASLENAISRLEDRIIVVFLSQALKTTITSIFILFLIRVLVTTHVEKIALYFEKHDVGAKPQKLKLERHIFKSKYDDEFDSLAASVNDMVTRLDKEFNQRTLAEKELLKMNENLENVVESRTNQLVEASKLASLGEMAGGVAHEINSPLSVVHGLNRRLKRQLNDKESPEVLKESLDKIENLVDRIFVITKGLGIFSRDSSHDKFVDTEIYNILTTVVDYANVRYLKSNVAISLNGETEQFNVNCQKNTISQILNTLISHSVVRIKDLKENWISISTKYVDGYNEIWINDSAEGLYSDVKDCIENPFSVRKGVEKGSGLELSLLRGMVESQNILVKFGDGANNYKYRLVFKNTVVKESA